MFDNIPVVVPIAPGAAPRFIAGAVDEFRTSSECAGMRGLEVQDAEANLHPARGFVALCLVEGEVEKRAVRPGDGSVAAANPAVIVIVAACLEVHPEAFTIEPYGAIQVCDFDDDSDYPA